VAIVFFLVQYLFIQLLSSDGTTPEGTVWTASFFPHAGIQMAFDNLISYQVQKTNYSFKNTNELLNNYKLSMTYSMNFLNILIYLVITLYLDQVWPNEWGSKKHPLFCFMKKKSTVGDTTVEAS
jgi:ATP-binding cassette, subfamily A (ABC1), member 3